MSDGKIYKSEFVKPKLFTKEQELIDIKIEIPKNIENEKVSVFYIIKFLITQSPKLIRLIYLVVKLLNKLKGTNMKKDKKTTVSGIVKAVLAVLAIILNFTGIELPEGTSEILTGAIISVWALVDLVQSIFTKDKDEVNE